MKSEFTQLPPEYLNMLLAGTARLLESMPKIGDCLRINENQFWIRLYEPENSPFKQKFYKIDMRCKHPEIRSVIPIDEIADLPPPGRHNDQFLVYFDRWVLPRVGHVYWDPGRDQENGGVFGYTIEFSRKEFLHVPKRGGTDWCLGIVYEMIALVED